MTSLDPGRVAPEGLLRRARGHWQIENGLHFVKDRWWDEDRHAVRRPGLGAMLTGLNSLALSLHRLLSDAARPLRASADDVAWNPALGLAMLRN